MLVAVAVAIAVDGVGASASVVFASAPVQVVELVGVAVQVVQVVDAEVAEVGLAEFESVDVAFVAVVEEVPAEGKGIIHDPGGMEDSENRIAG